MCRPGVAAANQLFSLWRTPWRPTAPASRTKSRRTAEESRTRKGSMRDPWMPIFRKRDMCKTEIKDVKSDYWCCVIREMSFCLCECLQRKKHTFYKPERQCQVRFTHVTVPMFPAFTFGLYPIFSLNTMLLFKYQLGFGNVF